MVIAAGVHKANEYRNDIFFPDTNTTFEDRLEASFVVGAVPLYIATPFVAPATASIPIYAAVGGATGATGNVAGQVLNNRLIGQKNWTESLQSVNWTDVKVAGGVNFMAGGLAPGIGQSFWGNIALGATANSSQYTLSQCVNNRPFSIFDFGFNATLGGAVNWGLGPTPSLGPGSFAYPVKGGPGWSIQGAAEYELLRLQMDAINRVGIARATTGATATNIDWVHLLDLPHPGEME
ncbi:MAG: hypothetical protein D6732_29030 [Methanobacteriota archaeon]|nr:MAG: hypothetical protein D6732_29030 [Euryarchaeota archaeon]